MYTTQQLQEKKQDHKLGDDFEAYFARATDPLGNVLKADSFYSVWDFRYFDTRIELKSRRFNFGDYDSVMITIDKFKKLREFPSALFFVRFNNGHIYVSNLTEINSPLREKTTIIRGVTNSNYMIPNRYFKYMKDEAAIRDYLTVIEREQYKAFTKEVN